MEMKGKHLLSTPRGDRVQDSDAVHMSRGMLDLEGKEGFECKFLGLRSSLGTYLRTEPSGRVRQTVHLQEWETFQLENAGEGGKVYLKDAFGKYLCALKKGGFETRMRRSAWTTFEWIPLIDSTATTATTTTTKTTTATATTHSIISTTSTTDTMKSETSASIETIVGTPSSSSEAQNPMSSRRSHNEHSPTKHSNEQLQDGLLVALKTCHETFVSACKNRTHLTQVKSLCNKKTNLGVSDALEAFFVVPLAAPISDLVIDSEGTKWSLRSFIQEVSLAFKGHKRTAAQAPSFLEIEEALLLAALGRSCYCDDPCNAPMYPAKALAKQGGRYSHAVVFGGAVASNTNGRMLVVFSERENRDRAMEGNVQERKAGRVPMYVVFKGTSNPKDILCDLKSLSLAHFAGSIKPIAGSGFVSQFNLISAKIGGDLSEYIKKKACNASKIVITGHSLGGALACLCFYLLRKDASLRNMLRLVTFGAPRTFDVDVARELHRKDQACCTRWVNLRDPVPCLPPSLLAGHFGSPRYINFDKDSVSTKWTLDEYERDFAPPVSSGFLVGNHYLTSYADNLVSASLSFFGKVPEL